MSALNEVNLLARKKEIGTGPNKRHWVIKNNKARELRFGSHSKIVVLHHFINNSGIACRSWKQWDSPKNYGMAMEIVVSYRTIYYPIANENYGNEHKVDYVMDYLKSRECLSYGVLRHVPKDRRYPGDDRFRTLR